MKLTANENVKKQGPCENPLGGKISLPLEPATIATTWLKKQSGVLSLLIGARNKSEVQLNINSFDYDIDDSVLDEYVTFTEKIKNHIGSNPDMWNAVSEYR